MIFARGIYDALKNHLSCVTCYMSGVACHFSNHSQTVKAITSKFSHDAHHTIPCVMCPVSHVRCHWFLVMCHMSGVTCHNKKIKFLSGGFIWWRVFYWWGLPCLVSRLFLNKNMVLPKIYLSRLIVVLVSKKNWWEFNFRDIWRGKKYQKWQTLALSTPAPCAYF